MSDEYSNKLPITIHFLTNGLKCCMTKESTTIDLLPLLDLVAPLHQRLKQFEASPATFFVDNTLLAPHPRLNSFRSFLSNRQYQRTLYSPHAHN